MIAHFCWGMNLVCVGVRACTCARVCVYFLVLLFVSEMINFFQTRNTLQILKERAIF